MFHSATIRLTLWYLAIIMLVSAAFSWALYATTDRELRLGLRRQAGIIRQFPGYTSFLAQPQDFETQLAEAEGHLQLDLLFVNLLILGGGGAASYFLAKRTLRPIEEALDVQSRFTADASHELRTPLTAMRTEIEVALREKKIGPAEAKALLTSNLEEIAKLEALSGALLKLAQHDQNQLELVACSLKSIATASVERLEVVAKAKHITIINNTGDLSVMGDEQSLADLLVILLDNAIKYSPAKTTITLDARKHANLAHLTVSDQGRGIKALDLPRIFDRFFRADASRSAQDVSGYGLGLAIARQIVETHGGSIEADSTPGQGSVFTVKLPLANSKSA